ncbi:Protein phosphatase 2C 2 [Thoreauomyces humboldtii]|nr:Protein phosphatase 2C 2 [Thoreauomyces humboldtii]
MGQTLSEPVTEKHSSADEDERIAYGASAMQGWRISMEDAHTTILKMTAPDSSSKHISFFAVFDGHGGSNVAKYSGENVHNRVAAEPHFYDADAADYASALKNGFLGIDTDLRKDDRFNNDPSGCTAVAAIITDDWRIIVGNAGDSRAVLSANGVAVPLSFDHKPVNPEETQRITAAGGFVEFGRVNGNLALSRAIGDFEFKKSSNLPAEQQVVTANPDVTERKLLDTDEFVVVACDGIWDCMSNQQVVDFVRQKVVAGLSLQQICETMMEHCLASASDLGGVGCDNMTVVVVALTKSHGGSKDKWAEEVATRAKAAGIRVDEVTPKVTDQDESD